MCQESLAAGRLQSPELRLQPESGHYIPRMSQGLSLLRFCLSTQEFHSAVKSLGRAAFGERHGDQIALLLRSGQALGNFHQPLRASAG